MVQELLKCVLQAFRRCQRRLDCDARCAGLSLLDGVHKTSWSSRSRSSSSIVAVWRHLPTTSLLNYGQVSSLVALFSMKVRTAQRAAKFAQRHRSNPTPPMPQSWSFVFC